MIERLLDGVEIRTETDFLDNREQWMSVAEKIVYTGPIDAFYDYCYGRLEWRTVRFEQEIKSVPNYQGNAVVNYTDLETPYTRIIEHKHFESFGLAVYDTPHTVISKEYSCEWEPGLEPFYAVNDERNQQLFLRYERLANSEDRVIFGGRLAEYKYYDMAPVIERAKAVYEQCR